MFSGLGLKNNVKHFSHFYFFLLLTSLFISCAVNPVTGESELALISEAQEIEMGKQYYGPTIQSFDGIYPDPKAQSYLNQIGQRLAAKSHRPGLNYEFKLVNTSMVNAFALPGGKICVTRGLLQHFNREAQLAAVLGHEIGHVTARHGVRQMSRQMLFGTLMNVGAVALDAKGTPHRDAFLTLGAVGLQAGLAKYSRDQETQSDELGLNYMTKLNYDPQGAVEVFQVFQKLQKAEPSAMDQLFLSHPQSKDRVAHAKALIATKYSLQAQKKSKISSGPEFDRLIQKIKNEKKYYDAHDKGVQAASKRLWNQAISHFKTALKGKPKEALFHTHIGYAYTKKNELKLAEKHFKKAIKYYPGFFKPLFFLGVLKYDQQDARGAIRYLSEADMIIPGVPYLRLILGESFERARAVRRAVEYYKYVYQSVPRSNPGHVAAQHLIRLGVLKARSNSSSGVRF